ncbi:LysR family transcriptional regulator [Bacteroides sp.]|uniref:LysR family transcriptional regulator n=1 Tax=Bacteroides sp. TaxID=29523 RepID=UPI0026156A38|nr:LysR family transcriptional regulator [Bacteroides sp.]MDD3040837.1 LysR family transcriptional regulator [Bacteroides sp.]
MDFRILNYFLMVAREENITKAAQILHVSQPTLSRQLIQLEQELGVKLFRRSNHTIYLTTEGMLFRRRASELVQLAEKMKLELSQQEETVSGEISIGCGELLSIQELGSLVSSFQQKHPLVKFHLHSSYTQDIKDWLEQGVLDLGLMLEPVDVSKYNFVRMQQKEEWGVLVRDDSPLAQAKVLLPQDLAKVPIITTRNMKVDSEIVSWFGDYAKQMHVVLTYNLLYNGAMMVRQGMGVALGLNLHCHYPGLKFIPMVPKLELSSVLVWQEHQVYSKAVQAFIQFVKTCKKELLLTTSPT